MGVGALGERSVALIALALTPGLIPESRSSRDASLRRRRRRQITAGLSMLAYALLDASSAGWGSTKIVSLLAFSVP